MCELAESNKDNNNASPLVCFGVMLGAWKNNDQKWIVHVIP